jgi:hypothetical protein
METSCNCLWTFLCPLAAILGIQFGRFPAVSRFPLLQSDAERGLARVLSLFQDATSTSQQ